jgi:hypothetical protein
MKKIFLVVVMAFVAFSCKEAPKDGEVTKNEVSDETQAQFAGMQEEAMEAHDVIMPKMGDLMRLKNELGQVGDASPMIADQQMALQKAHDDMMSWMHSYSEKFPYEYELPQDATAAAQKLEEMKVEKNTIVELKKRTIDIIAQTEELLEQ